MQRGQKDPVRGTRKAFPSDWQVPSPSSNRRTIVDEKRDVSRQGALAAQKAKPLLGCIPSSVASRVSEGILPLCSALLRPPGSTASSPGVPSARQTGSCWSGARGGTRERSEGWNPSAAEKGRESWGCPAWRREGSGETFLRPFSTERGLVTETGTEFLAGPGAIGQGGMVLN